MATTPELDLHADAVSRPLTPKPWPLLTRIAFRATFTYFMLTIWLWLDELAVRPTRPMQKIYPIFANHLSAFLARHLLHTTQVYKPNSFRDTHYLYLVLLGCLLITALITVIWSVLDRKRPEYTRLHGLFRIFLRYSLSYMILLYGMDKVIKLQFPAPSLSRLIENYGDSSPMALMWTFMGFSTAYTIFGGLAEVAAGILVLFRKTTLLGALLAAGVMANVAIMDFSYDVSVKLYAVNLMLMALVLVAPDTKRLLDVFLLNRTAPPADLGTLPTEPRRRWAYLVLKTLVVLYLLVPLTLRNLKTYREVGPHAPKFSLYGLYRVDAFRSNGVLKPALLDDAGRWRYVAIESKDTLYVKHMDDSLTRYSVQYDAKTHTAVIHSDPAKSTGDATPSSGSLVASQQGGKLELSGVVDGQTLEVDLEPVDPQKFLLNSRGFHWISESSFFK
jgi:hypothetical protein